MRFNKLDNPFATFFCWTFMQGLRDSQRKEIDKRITDNVRRLIWGRLDMWDGGHSPIFTKGGEFQL